MDLSNQNIEYCKGVGAKCADILRKEFGVKYALDMLYQFPYKYIDRSRFYFIHEIEDEDTYVQIIGHITEWHTIGTGATARLSANYVDLGLPSGTLWKRQNESGYYMLLFSALP